MTGIMKKTIRIRFVYLFLLLSGCFLLGGIVFWPCTGRTGQPTSEETCWNNLREIDTALRRYKDDQRRYPSNLEQLYPEYIRDRDVLSCPKARDGRGYIYVEPGETNAGATRVLCLDNHIHYHRRWVWIGIKAYPYDMQIHLLSDGRIRARYYPRR